MQYSASLEEVKTLYIRGFDSELKNLGEGDLGRIRNCGKTNMDELDLVMELNENHLGIAKGRVALIER
jgi:hypothetical protein